MDAIVRARGLKKTYGQVHAVNGVDLELEQGAQYAIRGASGSGKSTLLYLLAGLERPSAGEILVDGKHLDGMDEEALAQYRNRKVGLVFQFHFLLPSMNCLDNVLLPARIGGVDVELVRREAHALAKLLGVAHCLPKFPYQISGGEQQRVNLMRALSLRPKLLLCDEPTGNLDSANSQKVTYLLGDLAREFGSTLVVVTHDDHVASHFSRQLFMRDGALFHQ